MTRFTARSALLATVLLVTGVVLASPSGAAPAPDGVTSDAAAAGTGDPAAAVTSGPVPGRHQVTYDRYSVMVDGHRILVQAAEFHYFRLPSPDLWRDVLEKYKAAGFNAVSLYFHWGYHSPKAGVYDFTGVRDVDRLLRLARDAGLYVIARPGPYINAETTGGGFPAWLKQVPGRARSSAPGYTAAYREWLHRIDPIIAAHQVTRGGPVLLYQVENEYQANTDAAYMQDLQDTARGDGIDVPIMTNVCCDAADWTSKWNSGPGAVQIPGVDDYPQSFECQNAATTWGPWGEGVTERLRDDAPVFAAEYQAGAPDINGAGAEACRALTGPAYMSYFFKNNLITSGATAFNYYMGFGGTSWGFLPQPNDGFTSYDYGAAITEARQLTEKYDEFKRQSYFLTSVPSLAKTDPAAAPAAGNAAVRTLARANPDTGTQFVLVRHADRAATTVSATTLDWATPDGRHRVPVTLTGRDAAVLVAGHDFGGQRLVVSGSELLTSTVVRGRSGAEDVAVFHGADGTPGATVLRYRGRPSVRVLAGAVQSAYDPATGDLTLRYTHSGLARVQITGGGRRPLLLMLGTDAEAATFWRVATPGGPLLVRGTDLVRAAAVRGPVLDLRADTSRPGPIEVFAPGDQVRVNGVPVRVRPTSSGSRIGSLPGPVPVSLPELSGWRHHAGAPEAAPSFDDSAWTVADRTTSESPIPPVTLPVLHADDYGFHHGSVWYRGRFTATGGETAVKLNAVTGKRGVYQVWLNGTYLGSAAGGVQADSDAPINSDPGPGTFSIPAGALRPGAPATFAVLVQNMGHNDDWTADDTRFKQPRGLVGARVVGEGAAGTAIAWRIQGARGGENLADPARGPLNTGGLYGERSGWHLPGFDDRSWTPVAGVAGRRVPPGVAWYRTSFGLDLPRGQDSSVVLRFGDQPARGYRVIAFLNGWNVGQFSGDIGPQRDFVLPAGLLRERGRNQLALAVVSQGDATLGAVGLAVAGSQRGGVRVADVR